MSERPNIHQQIEEVQRELALRASVYPAWVSRGKLRQVEADEHIRRLLAVHDTLVFVRDHREAIAAAHRAGHSLAAVADGSAGAVQ